MSVHRDENWRRQITIVELVSEQDVSVRLFNCIKNLSDSPELSVLKTGEYLDSSGNVSEVIQNQIRNFGQKCAQELELLILRFVAGELDCNSLAQSDIRSIPDTSELDNIVHQIASSFADIRFVDAIQELGGSRRSLNSLKNSNFKDWKASDFFHEYPKSINKLSRTLGLGKKSVIEIENLTVELLRKGLTRLAWAGSSMDLAILAVTEPNAFAEIDMPLVAEASRGIRNMSPLSLEELAADEIDGLDVAQYLSELMKQLPIRSREVVCCHNGLIGHDFETLEQIAQRHGLTRERIRQIEVKALRQILKKSTRSGLRRLIADDEDLIWEQISDGEPYVNSQTILVKKNAVSREIIFAIECVFESIENWLDEFTQSFGLGWYRADTSNNELNQCAKLISDQVGNLNLPMPCELLVKDIDTSIVDICLGLSSRYVGYLGYVADGPTLSLHNRRAIRLSRMLRLYGRPLIISSIKENYCNSYPDDVCTFRALNVVLEKFEHLFLNTHHDYWCGVIGTDEMRESADIIESVVASIEDENVEVRNIDSNDEHTTANMTSRIVSIIEEKGPLAISELKSEIERKFPGEYALNGLAFMLSSYGEFKRVLPNIWGLQKHLEQAETLISMGPEYLLSDIQCRQFSVAKYAGEGPKLFPFWTPSAEFQLANWARFNTSKTNFESLLAVATPEEWPVGDADRIYWLEQKRLKGLYQLKSQLSDFLPKHLPNLKVLFASVIIAKNWGRFGWVIGNIVRGTTRPNSSASALLLGVLIGIGVLKNPGHWQRNHEVGENTDAIINILNNIYAEQGEMDWNGTNGAHILDILSNAQDNIGQGWFGQEKLFKLINLIQDCQNSGNHTMGSETPQPAGLDSLLNNLIEEEENSFDTEFIKKISGDGI